MPSVAFHTLGCKVNSYETEQMRQQLLAAGFTEHAFAPGADIYIINTCTVTNVADRKSRQILHRAKEMNPEATVVAVGCYVEDARAALEADPLVDLCVGNEEKENLLEVLTNAMQATCESTSLRSARCARNSLGRSVSMSPVSEDLQENVSELSSATPALCARCRAFVKIEDGCNQFCTYCMIPYVRGRVKSRPAEEIIAEVQQLAAGGTKEVVITGIHVSSYGLDIDHPGKNLQTPMAAAAETNVRLLKLLREIDAVEGIARIRLGSLEPGVITADFLQGLSALQTFCPSFHLSLQSGCDKTLQAMGRKYSCADYAEKVQMIRASFPDASLTTDIIVGFPGETEADFQASLDFAEAMQFAKIHVFPYSRRKGTKADRMPDQLPQAVKKERVQRLLAVDAAAQAAFAARFIGREVEILTEEAVTVDGQPYMKGYTRSYVPAYLPDPAARLASNCVFIVEGEREKDGHLYLACLTNKKRVK